MSNIQQLTESLDKSANDFSTYVRSNYSETSNVPVTNADFAEFGQQVYYALRDIDKYVIDYFYMLNCSLML